MSGWGSIGRPLVIIITVALASMTAVSSLLVFTAQQTTQARIELVASQALQAELTEDASAAAGQIAHDLERIERTLASAAATTIGGDPQASPAREVLQVTAAAAQHHGGQIVWLDSAGRLLYTSDPASQSLVGSDLSDRRYYELPLATGKPFIVHSFKGIDGKSNSFAVAVPVTNRDDGGSFAGVLAALVPISSVKDSFLTADFAHKKVAVIASDGTILLYPSSTGGSSESLEGRNVNDPEVVGMLADNGDREMVSKNLRLLSQGRMGVFEYREKGEGGGGGGEPSLMAYEPVTINGVHTWTVAVIQSTASVREPFVGIFEERQNFTVIATVLIAAISGIFIAFILLLNRRLFATVSQQGAKIQNQLSEIQRAYERLKEQDVIKDEFINIAAHELRTPVLPMVLSAENLADSMPDDENVKIILRNANRITKLTNDILDVSRVESNTFKLQKQKTNIKKLAEDVIADAEVKIPPAQKLRLVLESRIPAQMEELNIDRSRIMQVLVNLVDNAINFTESGTIRVFLEQDGDRPGYVRISVIDQGKGIDPSVRDKLFGKFVSKSDRAKGTGLGLYLSKAIVEAHGGTIWGENNGEGEKGATFAFTLPVAA
ncbi:MAG: ATP-binding protein [Thermoproteota archaeon]